MSHDHLDIHDLVRELTLAHTHAEPYTQRRGTEIWNGRHVTSVPALVHQLLEATPAGSGEEAGGTSNGGAHSRPAARIEAVDTLMLIDDEAARWLRHLGEDDPGDQLHPTTRRPVPGSGTIACIRRLHALHANATACSRITGRRDDHGAWCCTRHHIEHDVRRWWRQARIISGWDSPAWRPDNTCPVCEQRRALRVSLALSSAFCVECRTTWDPTEIGLLAEHIRAENAEDLATA